MIINITESKGLSVAAFCFHNTVNRAGRFNCPKTSRKIARAGPPSRPVIKLPDFLRAEGAIVDADVVNRARCEAVSTFRSNSKV